MTVLRGQAAGKRYFGVRAAVSTATTAASTPELHGATWPGSTHFAPVPTMARSDVIA
jgi:hypothetical protein